MSDLIIKKNGTDYKLPMLAEHYPADRVYLDGDTSKTVQDALNNIVQFNVTPDSNGNAQLTGYLWSEYLPLIGRCTNLADVEISYISAEFASIGNIWIHARDVKTNAPITSAITVVIAFLKV